MDTLINNSTGSITTTANKYKYTINSTTPANSCIINPPTITGTTTPYTITIDPTVSLNTIQFYTKSQPYLEALEIAMHPEYAYTFENIKEIVPERVYQFTFKNKKKVKTIREENDPFDFEYMFYLAIAKTMYSKDYTFEGVLAKSYQLQYTKKYAKAVKDGIRLFKKLKEEEEKKKELEAIKKRQHEKYVNKKKEAKLRKEDKQVKLIAKAIKMSK